MKSLNRSKWYKAPASPQCYPQYKHFLPNIPFQYIGFWKRPAGDNGVGDIARRRAALVNEIKIGLTEWN